MKRRRSLPREILTDAESDALLEQCDGSLVGMRNRALLLLLEGTGCRISEVLHFDAGDFDWKKELVSVRHAKRGKRRVVPVAPEALVAVRAWLAARKRRGIPPTAPVCCNMRGARLGSPSARKIIPALARRAGIRKRVHAQGFRDRFTVRLARYPVVITSLCHVLGHANISTTYGYYRKIGASPAIDDVRKALRAMDRGRGLAMPMKVGP